MAFFKTRICPGLLSNTLCLALGDLHRGGIVGKNGFILLTRSFEIPVMVKKLNVFSQCHNISTSKEINFYGRRSSVSNSNTRYTGV